MAFAQNLKYLRKKHGFSQDYIAEKLGYKSFTTIQKWESNVAEPSVAKLRILANMFNVSMDQLLNSDLTAKKPDESSSWQPAITEKDKRDIAKEVDDIIGGLSSSAALSFDADDIDDETRDLLRKSLENVMETARLLAKKKYTPYKYRVPKEDK